MWKLKTSVSGHISQLKPSLMRESTGTKWLQRQMSPEDVLLQWPQRSTLSIWGGFSLFSSRMLYISDLEVILIRAYQPWKVTDWQPRRLHGMWPNTENETMFKIKPGYLLPICHFQLNSAAPPGSSLPKVNPDCIVILTASRTGALHTICHAAFNQEP